MSILHQQNDFRRVAGLGYRLLSAWSPVRVRPPEPNAGVAQLVEHVIPSSSLIRRFFQRAVDCGLSELLLGGSNPPFRFGGSSSIGQSSSQHPPSLLARCFWWPCASTFDGPKTSGYLSLVRLQSGAPNAPVAKWYSNSRVVPSPSAHFLRAEEHGLSLQMTTPRSLTCPQFSNNVAADVSRL